MLYDSLIIGGGILGLATAYKIMAENPGHKLCLLEKEKVLGTHQTGHNSGVIHSGLYYKPGSLKATNCIRGYQQMLQFCEKEAIPHEICGKIVVATRPEQIPVMYQLLERGKKNGLKGLKLLKSEELKEHEPYVAGIEGIWVPQTGIVDYQQVVQKLAEKVILQGGEVKLQEKAIDINISKETVRVATEKNTYTAKLLINCAGLYSDKIAKITKQKLNFRIIPFRGEYYKIKKEKSWLVKNLIYPVPDPGFPFLGVHFTRMIKGGIEAGPNAVLAYKREGYKKSDVQLDELMDILTWPGFLRLAAKHWQTGCGEMYRSYSKGAFARALQQLVPDIQKEDLEKGGSGVRAQACDRSGKLIDDFLILEDPRIINVCNAPSPAATASLSIGETVAGLALKKLS